MNPKLISIIDILNTWKSADDAVLKDGSLLIHKLKTVSPLGYLHRLYAPLTPVHLSKIESLLKTSLSKEYRDFLLRFNGLDIFNRELSIFGLRSRENMGYFKSLVQPQDIIIQNLGREQKPGFIQIATFQGLDVFMATDGSDQVYIMEDYDFSEYLSFYDWLEEAATFLHQQHNSNIIKKPQFKATLVFNTHRLS